LEELTTWTGEIHVSYIGFTTRQPLNTTSTYFGIIVLHSCKEL